MIRKLLCWLGKHEWNLELHMYSLDLTYRCKHCGKVKK